MLILNYWIDGPNRLLIKFPIEFWANFYGPCKTWNVEFHIWYSKWIFISIHDGNWKIPPFFPSESREFVECETSCEILAVPLIVPGLSAGQLDLRQVDSGGIEIVPDGFICVSKKSQRWSKTEKTRLEGIIIHEVKNQNILIYSITLRRISWI